MSQHADPSAGVEIIFDDNPPDSWRELVDAGVDEHNIAITGVAEWYPVQLFLRATDGRCLGGLLGTIWGGWLEVTSLSVAEELRGQGYGTALLSRAERYAVEKGCSSATLETHNLRARWLYEKLGYVAFATLEDYPPGHSKVYLRKQLSP